MRGKSAGPHHEKVRLSRFDQTIRLGELFLGGTLLRGQESPFDLHQIQELGCDLAHQLVLWLVGLSARLASQADNPEYRNLEGVDQRSERRSRVGESGVLAEKRGFSSAQLSAGTDSYSVSFVGCHDQLAFVHSEIDQILQVRAG